MTDYQKQAQNDVQKGLGSPAPTSFPNAQAQKDYDAARKAALAAQAKK